MRKSANHSLQIISMRFKKGPWKQNIFSVEHDSLLQVQKKHRKISDTNRMKRFQ